MDAAGHRGPSPEGFEAYLDLTSEEIARIVLCLLIEESLRERLAVFRVAAENGDVCMPAPDAMPAATECAAR